MRVYDKSRGQKCSSTNISEFIKFWQHCGNAALDNYMSSGTPCHVALKAICHGKPVIRNLRYPVESMLSGKAEIGKAESRNK